MRAWKGIWDDVRKGRPRDESLWVAQALMERRSRSRHRLSRLGGWVEGAAMVVGCILLVAFLALGGPLFF